MEFPWIYIPGDDVTFSSLEEFVDFLGDDKFCDSAMKKQALKITEDIYDEEVVVHHRPY